MRAVAATVKVFTLLIASYLLLGAVAYVMPDRRVRDHVGETRYIGDLLNDYPKAILFTDLHVQDSYTLDCYTEAIIVNQALSLRTEGIKGILLLPRQQTGYPNQCASLERVMERADNLTTIHYGRYWHGSTFVVRILLVFLNFLQIRYLLYFVSTLLLLWCFARLWNKVSRIVAVAIPVGLLLVNVYVMQFSLQFAPVLLLAEAGMLWLGYHCRADNMQCGLFFLALGSLTSYFDLITVPTLTLGLPLLVWIACRRSTDWKQGSLGILKLSLWWLGGYVATWLTKWGLATLLTDTNILADAYAGGAGWLDDGGRFVFNAVAECAKRIHWPYLIPMVALLVFAMIRYPRRQGWSMALQYALVMFVPIAYYILMAKPAAYHSWFNYRAYATAVAALIAALAAMVDWSRITQLFSKNTDNDTDRA